MIDICCVFFVIWCRSQKKRGKRRWNAYNLLLTEYKWKMSTNTPAWCFCGNIDNFVYTFLAHILRFACWGLFISFRKHIISIFLIWHEIHIPRANARNNWRTLAHHKFIHINALCRLIYSERARVLAILLSLSLIHLVTLTRTACSLT